MNKLIYIILLSFISLVGCRHNSTQPMTSGLNVIKNSLDEQVKNKERIQFKEKSIFNFIDEFISDDRLLTQQVSVYKVDRFCVATALFQNESGFGGYQDVIVFSNQELKYGFERAIYQKYESVDNTSDIWFTGKFDYDASIKNDIETSKMLQESLNRWYKNNFTSKIKSTCATN